MRHCSLTPDHTPSREAVATLRRAKSPLGRRVAPVAGAAVEIHDRIGSALHTVKGGVGVFLFVDGDRMGCVRRKKKDLTVTWGMFKFDSQKQLAGAERDGSRSSDTV